MGLAISMILVLMVGASSAVELVVKVEVDAASGVKMVVMRVRMRSIATRFEIGNAVLVSCGSALKGLVMGDSGRNEIVETIVVQEFVETISGVAWLGKDTMLSVVEVFVGIESAKGRVTLVMFTELIATVKVLAVWFPSWSFAQEEREAGRL